MNNQPANTVLFESDASKSRINVENQIEYLKNVLNMSINSVKPKPVENINITEPYLPNYHKYRDDFLGEIQLEPILSLNSEKYTFYPIEYPAIYKNYKSQVAANWGVHEIDLANDKLDWENNLENDERLFIMYVLAFFNSFDGIVNANLKQNVIDVVKIKEAEAAYGKQYEMEIVHAETYSLLLDTFVNDNDLKDILINAIETMPAIKKKAEWCKKWIDSDKTYAHKIIAFAIVEGIFFSGSFASIYWLKSKHGKIMKGLRKANRYIARDENLHVILACKLYALLNNKLKESVVYEIMDEAIKHEIEFINDSLPCRLLGMNAELMSNYIMYCADRLLVQLGYSKKYNKKISLDFMGKIDVHCKQNFFEERNDSYSDAKIDNTNEFVILDDF